jgi:anaerobic ribonucleoside-triphosphate reductase
MADKELIKQEIERLQRNLNECISPNNPILPGTLNVTFDRLKDFIDSLPEPASEDLEEYAKKLAKGAALDKHNLIWMCKKGAEWQKQKDLQDFLEKAEMYLKTRVYYNMHPNNVITAIQDFKNYIQNESEN